MLNTINDNVNIKKIEETSSSKIDSIEIIKSEDKNVIKKTVKPKDNKDNKENINYNLFNLKDILNQQELLKKHLNELKKKNIDNIYNENKNFIDYFHEKYDTNIYGDNTSDMELQNLKKSKYIYLNSTESIEEYNRPLINVSQFYDDRKLMEKKKNEQKFNTMSYGLCNDSIIDENDPKDPKEYLRKKVFNVLMPGIQELLS